MQNQFADRAAAQTMRALTITGVMAVAAGETDNPNEFIAGVLARCLSQLAEQSGNHNSLLLIMEGKGEPGNMEWRSKIQMDYLDVDPTTLLNIDKVDESFGGGS